MAEELPKGTERCSQPSWEDCLLILNDPLSVPMSPTLCLFLDPPGQKQSFLLWALQGQHWPPSLTVD